MLPSKIKAQTFQNKPFLGGIKLQRGICLIMSLTVTVAYIADKVDAFVSLINCFTSHFTDTSDHRCNLVSMKFGPVIKLALGHLSVVTHTCKPISGGARST